jgi:hypothetical protein
MTQVARPAADVSNSGWSPTPLYAQINTPTPNDGAPIACALPPGGSFEAALAPMARPITGTHTLTVRLQKTDPTVSLVTFSLLQGPEPGASLISAQSVVPTQGFVSYNLTLREQEIDLITDYANLLLRVLAGGGSGSGSGSQGSARSGSGSGPGVAIPCCTNALPLTLHATVANGSNCPNAGNSFPLVYNSAAGKWTGTGGIGGAGTSNVTVSFYCNTGGGSASDLRLDASFPDGCSFTQNGRSPFAGASCNPLSATFSVAIGAGQNCGCGGSGTASIFVTITL